MNNYTRSNEEISKFEQMSSDWWNPKGKFKPLHDLTPLRLEYILSTIKTHFNINSIEEISILDIGCGGGLITEPLSKLGSNILGIDASEINISIAKGHAEITKAPAKYKAILVEDLLKKSKTQFQVILALEVLEHVENPEFFIQCCCKLLKPGGIIIFSTLNKTINSFMKAILGAEYLFKWLPIGTHSWHKFIKPSEICEIAHKENLQIFDLRGVGYSILNKSWQLSDKIDTNYFLSFTKPYTNSHN